MKTKKIIAIVALMLLISLLFLAFSVPKHRPPNPVNEGKISLSTNKTPMYEKAPYEVIEFFERHEDIVLYANVSYNCEPVMNALVTFQVCGPPNPHENITLYKTVLTNTSGLGSFRFKIPSAVKDRTEIVFGNWTVKTQTKINGKILNDTKLFRVNWPIEILSLRTVDTTLFPRSYFPKKGDVGVEVTLRNNNAIPVKVVIRGNALDNQSVPVGHFELDGLEIPPCTKMTVYSKLALREDLVIFTGWATLEVAVYNEERLPYCPPASSRFFLRFWDLPMYILPQDVAVVNLSTSLNNVNVGETVQVSVVVKNKGEEIQNFTVFLYDNEFPIAAIRVNSLFPFSNRTLHFLWDTSKISYGNHSLRALATIVPWETYLLDNVSPIKTITLSLPPPSVEKEVPKSLFLVLLLILLLFLITSIAVVVYQKKKEKPFNPDEFTFFFLD